MASRETRHYKKRMKRVIAARTAFLKKALGEELTKDDLFRIKDISRHLDVSLIPLDLNRETFHGPQRAYMRKLLIEGWDKQNGSNKEANRVRIDDAGTAHADSPPGGSCSAGVGESSPVDSGTSD